MTLSLAEVNPLDTCREKQLIYGVVHTLSDPKPEIVVEDTISEACLQTWLTRVCGAASPFCVGWSRSSFVESTFSCLFLSVLKNHSDPEHLECCFSSGREALKQPGRKGGNERGLQLDGV